MFAPREPGVLWAEEDCDAAVILSVLFDQGQLWEQSLTNEFPTALSKDEHGRPRIHGFAHHVCNTYQRYAPCRPFIPA